MIAADRAGFLQRTNTAQAGRGGQSDAFGEIDIRHPSIGLQQTQNLPIDPVESHYAEPFHFSFWPTGCAVT